MAKKIRNDLATTSAVEPASTTKRQSGPVMARNSNQCVLPIRSRHDNASMIAETSGSMPAEIAEPGTEACRRRPRGKEHPVWTVPVALGLQAVASRAADPTGRTAIAVQGGVRFMCSSVVEPPMAMPCSVRAVPVANSARPPPATDSQGRIDFLGAMRSNPRY